MENRECQNCHNTFTIEPSDFEFYEKIKVPPPTWCPECRLQRRMSWRNERTLYKRKCEAPGHTEEIISMYDPSKGYHVYDVKYWWSDEWDPMEYGSDYDPPKHFFLQFSELVKRSPLSSLSTLNSINSDYTNFVEYNKDCYLVFGSGLNENIRYANKAMSCKDSQDLLMCTRLELGYDCVGCIECSRIYYSRNSKGCTDSYFLDNCKNCNECIGCTNLNNKSYHIFNRQYSKDEYFNEKKKLNLGKRDALNELRNKFNSLYLSSIHKHAFILNSQNCSGDNINHCKNCLNCFDIFQNLEDSKYQYSALEGSDCYDCNGMYKSTLAYECVDGDIGTKSLGNLIVYGAEDVKYSFNCHGCSHCFGCTGLRKKKYCILNKQYSPEEYTSRIAGIISDMNTNPYVDKNGRSYVYGDFFPTELSPFAYNETIVQEYFPLNKEIAQQSGFLWKDPDARDYKITKKSDELPNDLEKVSDEVLKETIACAHAGSCSEQCTTAFRITPVELDFYRRHNIPLPQLCSNCRHFARLKQRNPPRLWHRKCMKPGCNNEFETSYAPDRPEIVYCEQCYQQEVV